ncbi:amyloid protein-binding protein 2 [Coccinella septempunctata]|uniref:amyloid protein-binding protein 2 n=1 Tax=Coccinella septempunctata TaxID=41139 RepID=UPI001D094830|nr:amyloid protein-binding protein 2 [Coccinella septempunctata]
MSHTPSSLYEICLKVTVEDSVKGWPYKLCEKELRSLPNSILFDCYYELFTRDHLCILGSELGDVKILNRLLSVTSKRTKLLKMYQALLDHGNKCSSISTTLLSNYETLANISTSNPNALLIDVGIRIATFFNEGGWYDSTMGITEMAESLCKDFPRDESILKKLLECYHRRLYAQVNYKELIEAQRTMTLIEEVMKELGKLDALPNLAAIYSNFSGFYYMKSDYPKAVSWSQKALKSLNKDLPTRTVIEVLRQASKSCIVKRCFNQAGFLIKQALNLASKLYARDEHPQYADTLSDYGFYLLNSDSTEESVRIYEQALEIRKSVFKKYNINVALAHEDLAYVLYVHEYSSGSFATASEHAELALKIMNRILHSDHLLMASAKRVKALIIEEIALDLPVLDNANVQEKYLRESEELHKEALASSFKTFGEKNVLTAKQYGNLGRLYQSMKKLEEAEKMHLKAIAIKEELLGPYDYEVALSVGHLASLYNYQMCRFSDAEKLYKRSIEINVDLFGEAYSGLEYDYRGITHVYVKLSDTHNVHVYEQKMREWRRLRRQARAEENNNEILPVDQIVDTYFTMC